MPLLNLAGQPPTVRGVHDGHLAACPDRPNCVCSDAADSIHSINPLKFTLPSDQVWAAVRAAALSLPRTKVLDETEDYLHVECLSALLGFVDDLELHLRPQNGLVAVRSASRLGYRDFGVNRKRVERLRTILSEQGMIV